MDESTSQGNAESVPEAITGVVGPDGSAIPPEGAAPAQDAQPGEQTPSADVDAAAAQDAADAEAKLAEEKAAEEAKLAGADVEPPATTYDLDEAPEAAAVGEVYEHPEPTGLAWQRQDNVTEPGKQVTQQVGPDGPRRSVHEDGVQDVTGAELTDEPAE